MDTPSITHPRLPLGSDGLVLGRHLGSCALLGDPSQRAAPALRVWWISYIWLLVEPAKSLYQGAQLLQKLHPGIYDSQGAIAYGTKNFPASTSNPM